jgi:glutamate-1-semialdehyde 2,1-aminomutase
MKCSLSHEYFAHAKNIIPGGVNSPVRAFGQVDGEPVFFAKAKGAYLWDVDENKYIDYVSSWGVAILGHADNQVVEAIYEAAQKGLSFGAATPGETQLAEKIQQAFPTMEKIRLVSSGTEACMTAIRLARGYTGRNKILKFTGNYHGHADMLLAKAGSGVATLSLPGSAGVPPEVVQTTLIAPYNDLNAVKELFAQNKEQIAAVILEPITGNAGFIRPLPGYLEGLRELTTAEGALLIFDEVITGFRFCLGGVQKLYNIVPDLTTLGKIVGGGLPLAAFGGKKEIMDCMAPLGPVYQAGTLSGNPVAVASGLKTLELLFNKDPYPYLSQLSKSLTSGMLQMAREYHIPFQVESEGAMFGFFFANEKVTSFEMAQKADHSLFKTFFRKMLNRGIYLAPSPYEAGFVSITHTQSDIDNTIKACAEVFSEISKEMKH